MKLRIGHKLFLAMIVTTGLGVAVMVVAQRYTFEHGLLNYAQEIELDRLQVLIDALADRYARDDSWAFIEGREQWPPELLRIGRRHWLRQREDAFILRGLSGKPDGPPPPERFGRRDIAAPPAPALSRRISLIDANEQWVAGSAVSEDGARRGIVVDGSIVGYLVLAPIDVLSDALDLEFARQQLQAVSWAAVIALLGAAIAAAVLARGLGAPIRALAHGTHALAGGRYETRLDLAREDELGRLAEDFNSLAAVLQQSRQARQQWVADISHELRTPIAVLQAELEALEDGVRPLDGNAVTSLSAEVQRLRLLVDDLHQLAQADAGALSFEPASVNLAALLEETVDRFRERLATSGLTVELAAEDGTMLVADADRLRQLFANLLENALRYTDPAGTVRITSVTGAGKIEITVEDSAPGVPDEALTRLFDRLYRVDSSRSRGTGASGLGLAICESIVAAHGGTISARHSVLGGLAITVKLPPGKGAE